MLCGRSNNAGENKKSRTSETIKESGCSVVENICVTTSNARERKSVVSRSLASMSCTRIMSLDHTGDAAHARAAGLESSMLPLPLALVLVLLLLLAALPLLAGCFLREARDLGARIEAGAVGGADEDEAEEADEVDVDALSLLPLPLLLGEADSVLPSASSAGGGGAATWSMVSNSCTEHSFCRLYADSASVSCSTRPA